MQRIWDSNSEILGPSLLLCSINEILTWLFKHSHFWNGRHLIGINIIRSKCSNIFSYNKVTCSKVPCATAELSLPHFRASQAKLWSKWWMPYWLPRYWPSPPAGWQGRPRASSFIVVCHDVKEVGKDQPIQQWRWLRLRSPRICQPCLKGSMCAASWKHHNNLRRQGLYLHFTDRKTKRVTISLNQDWRVKGDEYKQSGTSGMGWSLRMESGIGCGSGV